METENQSVKGETKEQIRGGRRLPLLTRKERRAAVRWVADTTWSNQEAYLLDQGYMDCVADILSHPVFGSMDQFIQHGSTSCKSHCIQVSYLSYCICRKFGWDYRGAARAGLLHDLFLYDWHTHARETGDHFHGFTHPRTALNNARKYFKLTEAEEEVILRHMWPLTPLPPRTGAGLSVVYADKLCSVAETALQVRGWFAMNFLYRRKFL